MSDYKFDPFKFISNRESSVPTTENDFKNFNNFMSCAVVSMNPKYSAVLPYLNTIAFGRLSKKAQCLAYTSLNGKPFPFKPWLKSSNKSKSNNDDVENISKLLNVEEKKVKFMIRNNLINVDEVLLLYKELYEPGDLLTKTGKIKNI